MTPSEAAVSIAAGRSFARASPNAYCLPISRHGAASERSTCLGRTCFEAQNSCHTWPHAVEFPIRYPPAASTLAPALRPITFKNKVLASVAYMAMVKHQLHRLSLGRAANPQVHPGLALLEQQWDNRLKNRRYRHWMRRKAG